MAASPTEVINSIASVSAILMSLLAVWSAKAKDDGVSSSTLASHDQELKRHSSRLDAHDNSLSELNATSMHLGKLADMAERADADRGKKIDEILRFTSEMRGELNARDRR